MSLSETERMEATVTGLVQGVYFRQFTLAQAKRLNLVGWVANQWDGTVYVVAEGEGSALRQLLDLLHKGPPTARVADVATTWPTPAGDFTDFRVRYL